MSVGHMPPSEGLAAGIALQRVSLESGEKAASSSSPQGNVSSSKKTISTPAGNALEGLGREKASPGFLESVFGAGGLVAAWIFAFGWTYLRTYYWQFGVNINTLDFPVHHYLAYCFQQLVSSSWTKELLLSVLILMVITVASLGVRTQSKKLAFLFGGLYLLLFGVGFHMANSNGRSAALDDMVAETTTLPTITLEFKDGFKAAGRFESGDISNALRVKKFRLLLENGDRLFVFDPVASADNETELRVLEIDRRDLGASMRRFVSER